MRICKHQQHKNRPLSHYRILPVSRDIGWPGSYLIHTVLCVQSTPRRWCETSETEHFGVLRSYSMNQVCQNMCRAINKNGSWTTKVAVSSLIATQNRKWSYWHYSCKSFLFLKLMVVEVFIPFSLSAIFVWSRDLSTPTTPPRKVVYSEQLLHSCSLILDWNSACPE